MKYLSDYGKNLLILDVRGAEAYRRSHIPKAVNIPMSDLKNKVGTIESYKDKSVVVYCKAGNNSTEAVNLLKAWGFQSIYHYEGGFDQWKVVYGFDL